MGAFPSFVSAKQPSTCLCLTTTSPTIYLLSVGSTSGFMWQPTWPVLPEMTSDVNETNRTFTGYGIHICSFGFFFSPQSAFNNCVHCVAAADTATLELSVQRTSTLATWIHTASRHVSKRGQSESLPHGCFVWFACTCISVMPGLEVIKTRVNYTDCSFYDWQYNPFLE